MITADRPRRFWGWGFEDEGPDPEQLRRAEAGLTAFFGAAPPPPEAPPRIEDLALRAPRPAATPPPSLSALCTQDPRARAGHTYGKSYRDLRRALGRDFTPAPDLVAYPESEADLIRLLDLCAGRRLAAIPYGGGTSVCGGVEPAVGPEYAGTVSIDLSRLGQVLEVCPTSRAARIQAGAFGPDIEAALSPHGLSLRHYPQSFACSTLGGWIATRSGGHFATLYTHIDELVESLRVVTPSGIVQTRRLPASGAGPAPERWFIGSEGALGILSEAWVRLHPRPRYRAGATLAFADVYTGARYLQALAQSGLYPANCRLLDPTEALINGVAAGPAVALLGFESADHPLDAWIDRGLECARDHGGTVMGRAKKEEGAAERWRSAFVRAPYLRDALVLRGLIVETFETAITWERFPAFHAEVLEATEAAVRAECGKGLVSSRVTHVYPDGAAPYYTVIAQARPGAELAQWAAIKEAATAAILAHGGTTTHHHAVGRDFRRYYEQERDPTFARALGAVKRALDPHWLLNPGVPISADG